MGVYVPDESLFVFDLAPPRQYVGAAAYRKNWEDFIGTMTGLKFEVTDFNVTADGELAYAHSIHYVSATDSDGQKVEFTVRVSDVYRKIEGQWLVVHEHVSVPIDLATGEPDMSSKP
jgi:ketosteroid isomerase-like protein